MLEHYGWDGVVRTRRRWSAIRCPFHRDRNASAALSTTLNSFRCHGCDVAGNSVSLVMAVEGLGAKDAVVWLDRELGTDRAEQAKREPKRRKMRLPWEPMTLRG